MEQNNNNNNVHIDAEAFENLRQQLTATQAENANLRAQLDEANEQEDVDAGNQTDLEELNRAEEEGDASSKKMQDFTGCLSARELKSLSNRWSKCLLSNCSSLSSIWTWKAGTGINDCINNSKTVTITYIKSRNIT
jgi:hypothetical protein